MKIKKAHLILSLNRRSFSYLDGLLFKKLITTFVRLYLIRWSLMNVVIGFLKSRPSRYNKRLLFKLMRCVSIHLKAYTTMLLILPIDIKALTIQKQKQSQEMFYGKDVLQKFPKIHRKTPAPEPLFLRKWQIEARNIIKKRGFGIGALCEFCKIFKNIFLTELLWAKRLDLPSLAYRSAQSNTIEL